MGPVSRITFCLSCLSRSQHTFWMPDGDWTPPHGGLGAHRRCFLALMVGTPGSLIAPSRGAAINIFYVDGGCSRNSVSTSQGAHHQRFLELMVGAPGPPSPPPWSLPMTFPSVDGGRSQNSITASQGGPPSTFLSIYGGHSWTSSTASQCAYHRYF
jgi:hypothetical protein